MTEVTQHMKDFFEILLDPTVPLLVVVTALVLLMGAIIFDWHRRIALRQAVGRSYYHLNNAADGTDWYVDADKFLSTPSNIDLVGIKFDRLIKRQHRAFDRIGFIENTSGPVGAITLKDFLSWRSGIPSIIVRLRKEIAELSIKGRPAHEDWEARVLETGESIVLITDVGTTGTTIVKAINIIQAQGGRVNLVVALFDRNQGAHEQIRGMNIPYEVLVAEKEELDRVAPPKRHKAEVISA